MNNIVTPQYTLHIEGHLIVSSNDKNKGEILVLADNNPNSGNWNVSGNLTLISKLHELTRCFAR